jgi:hypothetical protein
MYEDLRVASKVLPRLQPRQSALRSGSGVVNGDNVKPLPSSFDLDRGSRIEYLVENVIHIFSQF